MNKSRKILFVVIGALLLLSTFFSPVIAGEEDAIYVYNWTELVDNASQSGVHTIILANTSSNGAYLKPLTESEDGISIIGDITIRPIVSQGEVIKIDANQHGRIFRVTEFGNLTLDAPNEEKLVVTNGSFTDSKRGGGILVEKGGELNIFDGVSISNCMAWMGGGVSNSGMFTLNGGIINNCSVFFKTGSGGKGGGVCNIGAFTMINGEITDCIAEDGGNSNTGGAGVYVYSDGRTNGIFIMNGGNITNCKVFGTNGRGGGVLIDDGGRFDMYGGNIRDNYAQKGLGILNDRHSWTTTPAILNLGGCATISDMNDVALETGQFITLNITTPFSGSVLNITSIHADVDQILVKNGNAASGVYASKFNISNSLREDYFVKASGDNLILGCKNSLETYVEVGTWNELISAITEWGTRTEQRTIVITDNITERTEGPSTGVEINGNILIKPNISTVTSKYLLDDGTGWKYRLFHIKNTGALTITGNASTGLELVERGDIGGCGTVIYIDGGQLLIDRYVTITSATSSADGAIFITNGGNFVMYGGKINGTQVSYGSGAVRVLDGCTFNMYDGNIADNIGSGVAISGRGIFNMYDGNISDNVATDGGGVAISSTGIFNMYNGKICNNSATNGGGVAVFGNGEFNMFGGHVEKNSAINGGGIAIMDSSIVTIGDGIVSSNHADVCGGGIFLKKGTLTLIDGNIKENTISSGLNHYGSGIYIERGIYYPINPNIIDSSNNVETEYGKLSVDNSLLIPELPINKTIVELNGDMNISFDSSLWAWAVHPSGLDVVVTGVGLNITLHYVDAPNIDLSEHTIIGNLSSIDIDYDTMFIPQNSENEQGSFVKLQVIADGSNKSIENLPGIIGGLNATKTNWLKSENSNLFIGSMFEGNSSINANITSITVKFYVDKSWVDNNGGLENLHTYHISDVTSGSIIDDMEILHAVAEDNGYYVITVVSTEGFSAYSFAVESLSQTPVYSSSSSKQTGSTVILPDTEISPSTPTPTPVQTPVAEPAIPVSKSTAKPTQKSPAPVFGLLAGLGVAGLVIRLRK